jgi:cytochrome P450
MTRSTDRRPHEIERERSGMPNPLLPDFWTRPSTAIDDDIQTLRDAGGVTFHNEPEIPPEVPLPQGRGSWVVVNHPDILHVSKHADIFSSARGITLLDVPPEINEYFNSMIAMDDPRHARLRRLVSAGFTPRMLDRLEDTVREVAASIIDRIQDRGEVDFVVDVAAALPLKIVCDLMGIPESEYEFVFSHTNIILGVGDPEYVSSAEDSLVALLTAGQELTQLMQDVAESKTGGDGTDLTSVLVNARLDDDQLSPADIASFFILLVVAGNETTRNAISWGLKFLTDNPDQRRRWQSDFETLAPTAVEEIVRLASPVTYMRRTTTRDTELGGQEIPAGDKVCMFYYAANRDPGVFTDPARFDVGRDPAQHVGFGGPGPHFCLGAHLARREITVMFRELFRRLPDIEAAGDPDLLLSSFIRGVKHLPARFTPAS